VPLSRPLLIGLWQVSPVCCRRRVINNSGQRWLRGGQLLTVEITLKLKVSQLSISLPAKHQIGPLLHIHGNGFAALAAGSTGDDSDTPVFNLLDQDDRSVGVLELELQFGSSSSSAVWLQLLVVTHLVTLAGVTVNLVAH